MTLKLGCIADDFTGGTDLANNLVRAGMRTVQVDRRARRDAAAADVDAVVVALKSRTAPVGRGGGAVARRRALAARAGRDADLLQGLLDLRLDAARQHRPGRRGADGRAAGRLRRRHAGLPRERAHRVQGPPVRRRPAAVGQLDAQSPADADDRRQPRARAAGAARPARGRRVGLDRLPLRGAGRGGDRPAHRGAARRGRLARHRRRARRRRPAHARAGGARAWRSSSPARAWRSASRRCTAWRERAGGDAAAAARRARHRLGQLLGGDERAGRGLHRRRRCGVRGRSAAAWRRGATWSTRRWPGRAPQLGQTDRCWSTPPPSPPRCARCRQQLGAERAGALVEEALSRIAVGARRSAASASSSSPAARPRAPACRRWASRSCASARRSTPACRGATRARRTRRRAAPGAEVGQLRRHRFLPSRVRRLHDRRSRPAPRDLPRRPLALRARLRARDGRQHQRAPGRRRRRRLPHHADRRLPRQPAARRGWRAWTRTARRSTATARARRSRCTGASTTARPTRAA